MEDLTTPNPGVLNKIIQEKCEYDTDKVYERI